MFTKYLISLFFILLISTEEKKFVRNYDSNGNLVSEGWSNNNQKIDFWTFYYPNGEIAKKGHFDYGKKTGYWHFYTETSKLIKEGTNVNNKPNHWWIFYKNSGTLKIQLKDGLKDGYALVYRNNRLKKAQRYEANKKIGEWTSYFKFKRDNPDVEF